MLSPLQRLRGTPWDLRDVGKNGPRGGRRTRLIPPTSRRSQGVPRSLCRGESCLYVLQPFAFKRKHFFRVVSRLKHNVWVFLFPHFNHSNFVTTLPPPLLPKLHFPNKFLTSKGDNALLYAKISSKYTASLTVPLCIPKLARPSQSSDNDPAPVSSLTKSPLM